MSMSAPVVMSAAMQDLILRYRLPDEVTAELLSAGGERRVGKRVRVNTVKLVMDPRTKTYGSDTRPYSVDDFDRECPVSDDDMVAYRRFDGPKAARVLTPTSTLRALIVKKLTVPSDENMAVEPADWMMCPITHCLFVEPVTASDQMTYEREALLKHFEFRGEYSPMTRDKITSVGNVAVGYRNAMEAELERMRRVVIVIED